MKFLLNQRRTILLLRYVKYVKSFREQGNRCISESSNNLTKKEKKGRKKRNMNLESTCVLVESINWMAKEVTNRTSYPISFIKQGGQRGDRTPSRSGKFRMHGWQWVCKHSSRDVETCLQLFLRRRRPLERRIQDERATTSTGTLIVSANCSTRLLQADHRRSKGRCIARRRR